MIITQLTEDNATRYTGMIPAELLNDLSREYMRGLAVEDTEGSGTGPAIIWKLNNAEQENVPTEAEISFLGHLLFPGQLSC